MTVKIEKVVFTITNIDDESAGVKIDTEPHLPEDFDDLEETPAYTLGAALWLHLQDIYEGDVGRLQ